MSIPRRSISPIPEERIESLLNPAASIPEAPLHRPGPHPDRPAGSDGESQGLPSPHSHLAQVTVPVHTGRTLLLEPSRQETSEQASSLNHLARLPAAPAETRIHRSA